VQDGVGQSNADFAEYFDWRGRGHPLNPGVRFGFTGHKEYFMKNIGSVKDYRCARQLLLDAESAMLKTIASEKWRMKQLIGKSERSREEAEEECNQMRILVEQMLREREVCVPHAFIHACYISVRIRAALLRLTVARRPLLSASVSASPQVAYEGLEGGLMCAEEMRTRLADNIVHQRESVGIRAEAQRAVSTMEAERARERQVLEQLEAQLAAAKVSADVTRCTHAHTHARIPR
jgi:hypothetical protein